MRSRTSLRLASTCPPRCSIAHGSGSRDLDARVELRAGDIAEPVIDGKYDAIVSVLAIHHLFPDEKRHLLSRAWEHTQLGGIFVIADYFRPALDRLSELYELPDEPDPHEVEHDHPDTAAEHLTWLIAAGFAAVDVVWKTDDVGVLVAWRAEA